MGHMSHIAYLSLGSNLGDRESHLHRAILQLETNADCITAVSSFYETEPVEVTEQPWFLNCVVKLETSKFPEQLMLEILEIERKMGRQRIQKKGPRTIDIDILLFDDVILDTPGLAIPHAAMAARRFVLEPLAEIAPEARHPILGKTARELLKELPAGQEIRRMHELS
jgi:2-amino-4-hydroxy-6-hydroxymethyldihydropteridine diphosphokinase